HPRQCSARSSGEPRHSPKTRQCRRSARPSARRPGCSRLCRPSTGISWLPPESWCGHLILRTHARIGAYQIGIGAASRAPWRSRATPARSRFLLHPTHSAKPVAPDHQKKPAGCRGAPARLRIGGMITGPIIAEIAALVGDPARATMMAALLDGRALTASELAFAARITPQTASAHLAKLTEAGLVSVVRSGRHRYFRLVSPAVVDMIDGIVAVALEKRPRYHPLSRQARALGAARICYDHLAGRLSVDLTDSFVAREYVVLDAE